MILTSSSAGKYWLQAAETRLMDVTRFLYQPEKGAFVDVSSHRAVNLSSQTAHCYPCLLGAEQHLLNIPRVLENQVLLYKGVDYHLQDCVFIQPDSPGPYILAQVKSILRIKDKVRIHATILDRSPADPGQFYDDVWQFTCLFVLDLLKSLHSRESYSSQQQLFSVQLRSYVENSMQFHNPKHPTSWKDGLNFPITFGLQLKSLTHFSLALNVFNMSWIL